MRLPRDVRGSDLVRALRSLGYQSLSHYSGIAGLLLVAAAVGAWITARLTRPRQLA